MQEDMAPVPIPTSAIGTRIAEMADRMSSRKEAAKAAGVSAATFYRWINGDSPPVFTGVAKLAEAVGVSLDWVANGVGPMKPSEGAPAAADQVIGMEDYAFVPLYDAQCSAGSGAWNENCRVLTYISFTRYSLRKQGLTPEHLSAVRNAGESMDPDIADGDTVLIDHTRTTISGEGIYIIRLDDHLYAKRLQRNFDGVSIISTNKEYRDIVVPRDRLHELEIIGRAVWAAGWL